MIEKRNEADDGPLEIDVVLPERIVRVDQQGLGFVGLLDRAGQIVSFLAHPIYTRLGPDDPRLVSHIKQSLNAFAAFWTIV